MEINTVEKLKELRKSVVMFRDIGDSFKTADLTDDQLLNAYGAGYAPIPF